MAAYRKPLHVHQCDGCARHAKFSVYNSRHELVGHFCLVCANPKIREINEQEFARRQA